MASAAPAPACCIHCALPAPAGAEFCCAGCEAVFHFIKDAGLGDYYRLRQAPAPRAEDDSRESLALYDEPGARERFVRIAGDGACEADLVLEGLRCAACAWLVERVLARVPGVVSAEVNASSRRARVCWRDGEARPSQLFDAVRSAGYKAWPFEESRLAQVSARERRELLRRFAVAGLGMMQVMMYALPAYITADGEITPDAAQLMRWAGLALTFPVLAYSGAPFFAGAWRDARAARLGMDIPIALGLAAAFAASAFATWQGKGAVYFDSVAMFLFLVTGGRYLEHRALERAGRSLQRLAAFVPAPARRLRDEGTESDLVAAESLRAGDRVLVRAGETVPADGVLASARGAVSEALLSGESSPLAKEPGARLAAGSINCGDALILRVTHAGADTAISALRRMMEAAHFSRPPWVAMAERASRGFVAFILLAAAAAGLAWLAIDASRALWVAVSVLIVTCPCALSLATPVATTAAAGALARRNVVVARGRAIEALAGATDFVFDKTGTLTQGRPRLLETVTLGSLDSAACIALAAALGRDSPHPLDRALADTAPAGPAHAVETARIVAGSGLEGRVAGRWLRLGRADFAAALARRPPPQASIDASDTLVWLADENGWLAVFRIGDALRPEARAALDALRAKGLRLHLLTGDGLAAAERVARALGIAEVEARATPVRKQAYVRALQLAGARVAMVGDGINDAPVLALADVSIAMGGGASLAQVRADAVVVSDSLADLARAHQVARKTRRVIRENLAWALGYNLIVLPLAFAGLVTPLAAAIGMSASSLVVVGNALRVR